MRLEHEFSVPAPPDVVWAAVIDPERVAPCMPGATLTSVDGAEFSGGVKVKLGPVSLTYKGSGEFLETDEKARKVVIKASGKDARGNGTAAATVTVTLTPEGEGTKGTVVTDLTVTGKPAQFGRGMIVEVSGKLLNTFAGCLASKLGTPAAEAAPDPGPATEPATEPAPGAALADDGGDADADGEEPPPPAPPKPATRRRTAAKATSTPSVTADAADGAHLQLVGEQESEPAPAEPKPAAPKPAARQVNISSEAEAIDLMDYAGSSVAKRVIPVLLGLLAVFIVVRRLRHR
ncbi:MAG TPA: SRPBCC family protein [Pseudonocardiaceae bacterium]|nr:SRPBCC family protein [Pseudonocardiaceae bacterium]